MGITHKIRWLPTALKNLDQEATYIAQDNPKAAMEFIAEVRRQISRLVDHPDSGRSGRVIGTRELVINKFPYIIPYRVRSGCVEILRVFHTSRQYPPKS